MSRQIIPTIFPKHVFAEVKQWSFIQVNMWHSVAGWLQFIVKFSRLMVFSRWVPTLPSAFTLYICTDCRLQWTKALICQNLGNCFLKIGIKSGLCCTSFPQTPLFWQLLPFCSNIEIPISSYTTNFSLYNNHPVKKGHSVKYLSYLIFSFPFPKKSKLFTWLLGLLYLLLSFEWTKEDSKTFWWDHRFISVLS